MKQFLFMLAFISLTAHAQNAENQTPDTLPTVNYEIKDYLVISGNAKHTNNAPKAINKWNEANYGLGWQRSFKPSNTDYRYALEGGFFKESFGKQSAYVAGSWLQDLTQSPRVSLGVMAGLSYRVTRVRDGYYSIYPWPVKPNHTPIPFYGPRHIIGMAGIVAQIEIPHTPAVIQTTFIPKVGSMASGVFFTQLLINF